MYRLGNVLQPALADVLEWDLYDLANLIVDGLRDANSSRLGKLFEASSDVDAGAIKIVVFGDYVPEVDADAELHLLFLGNRSVALRNLVLNLDGAANGLDDAGELSNNAVACAAENVSAVGGDRLLDHSAIHAQGGSGGLFVNLCMVAISLHIGSENRSKPTFHGRGTSEATPNGENPHIV